MERGMRIELTASAWKAEVLPLYEPRVIYYHHINIDSTSLLYGIFGSRASHEIVYVIFKNESNICLILTHPFIYN